MKIHREAAAAIKFHSLYLFENEKAVWTGGLTTLVTYKAKDERGNVLAQSSFGWNRHPGCYRGQGLAARVGTSRYLALTDIANQLANRVPNP